uniref:Putative chaperone n=1 Tax=viral metagenome TaxID=1070528 RepID=A0A6M3KQR4_9ZZZZ
MGNPKGIDRRADTAEDLKRKLGKTGRPLKAGAQQKWLLGLVRQLVKTKEHRAFIDQMWAEEFDPRVLRGTWAAVWCMLLEAYEDPTDCPRCDGEGELTYELSDGSSVTRECRRCKGSGVRGIDADGFFRASPKLLDCGRKIAELEAMISILEVPGHVIVDVQHPHLMCDVTPTGALPPPAPAELPDPRGDVIEVG